MRFLDEDDLKLYLTLQAAADEFRSDAYRYRSGWRDYLYLLPCIVFALVAIAAVVFW